MQAFVIEGLNFVIRLKLGAYFFSQEGKRVSLNLKKGETRIIHQVFYRAKSL
jgi:hypothetical protein